MRFHQLPIRLRVYILCHPLALVPLMLAVLQRPQPTNWWLVGTLLLFTLIFSTWKVDLTVFHGKMTPTFAIVCLALLLQGLDAAILCGATGALVGSIIRPDKSRWAIRFFWPPLYRVGFNLGNCLLACLTAALVFDTVVRFAPESSLSPLLGVVAFTASYFAINTLGVALAISLQQGLPWLAVWRENFVWTAPGFFVAAVVTAGIQAGFQQLGIWSLLFLPPFYLIYFSYRNYLGRIHNYSAKVEQDMAHIQELNKLNQAIIASLATAIDAKDRYTCTHVNRVKHYATALARAAGLTGPELEAVVTGALVHDIGKLGIPDHILGKPGKLEPEEFRRIQSHVSIGTEILSPIPFPFPVVEVVRTHHERWDGLGYPQGLRGEEIPMGGRIIAIVDVFDALTSNRPYRRALTHEEALRILQDEGGRQFDPNLVALFEQIHSQARAELDQMEAESGLDAENGDLPLEGASALTQISQAAAEMAAVSDVAHALAEQETLEQISEVVVGRALTLLPADTAILYLRCANDQELVAAAVAGHYDDLLGGMTIQIGEGVAGWVAKEHQPRVNVSAALDVARRFSPDQSMELSAATAVPLLHGPDSLGVLAVYTLGFRTLSEHHLHVLNILAEHAAVAIQNSRRIERQRELAYTDPLTGVANSRNLVRHLDRLTFPSGLATKLPGGVFSVIMMDLDRFKEVNDTLGHLHGDETLRTVAQTLTRIARPGDLVCRYAGDEFVLLLPGATRKQAERIADRARESVDSLPPVQGQVKIGASVGVASFPEDGNDGRALLHVADQRMYEDKFHRRSGRDALTLTMPPELVSLR